MALIKCPECGNDVSDTAVNCPNCNYPFKKRKSLNGSKNSLVFIGLIILSISILVSVFLFMYIGNINSSNSSDSKVAANSTPTKVDYYENLNSSEKEVFNFLTDHINSFKDPNSVKVIGGQIMGGNNVQFLLISATNSFGGTLTSCFEIFVNLNQWEQLDSTSPLCNGKLSNQSDFNNALKDFLEGN